MFVDSRAKYTPAMRALLLIALVGLAHSTLITASQASGEARSGQAHSTLITASQASGDTRSGQASPAAQPAPPPGTDIYLVPLSGGLGSMKNAKPIPVSTAAGYDNQPMF